MEGQSDETREAIRFFRDAPPSVRHVQLKLVHENVPFTVCTADMPQKSSRDTLVSSSMIHVECEDTVKGRLRAVMRQWPRLVKAIDSGSLGIQLSDGTLYPIETLLTAPELLVNEEVPPEVVLYGRDSPLSHYEKAQRMHHVRGDEESAMSEISKALEAQPNNAVFWVLKGAIQGRSRKIRAAVQSLRKAHDLKPSYAKVTGFFLRLVWKFRFRRNSCCCCVVVFKISICSFN